MIRQKALVAFLTFGCTISSVLAADEKPFSKVQWLAIPMSKKANWSREQLAKLFCQTHQTTKISRKLIGEWLGEPTISAVVDPGNENSSTIDQYALAADSNKVLRFDYGKDGLTAHSPMIDDGSPRWEHFPGPGKFLKAETLNKFLTPAAIHTSYEDCVKLLGKPNTTWRETAQVGGRYWTWQICAWRLSPDGRKLLVTQWEVKAPATGKEAYRLYTYSTTQLGPDCPTKLDTD